MLTIGRIACRREGGDGSAQRERSVIYDCLVLYSSVQFVNSMPNIYWRRQLWDTGARAPSTSNSLFFFQLTNCRTAHSLTPTLCGCLCKHICILRQQLR